jgi:hypothetical protein
MGWSTALDQSPFEYRARLQQGCLLGLCVDLDPQVCGSLGRWCEKERAELFKR